MATIPIFSPQLMLPRLASSSASPSVFPARKPRTVVCNASIDRRDMLIGLGGLYGVASSGLIMPEQTIATPIASPDLSKCKKSTVTDSSGNEVVLPDSCCPPYSDNIVDFFPATPKRIRVRPAVQNMTSDQIAKYKEATRRMKALDKEDPRSFMQQAMVHCAYCNNAYDQVGIIPQQPLQIHNSWLFFPFHRWYLYFYEKILGKLIDDEDFVMPFWNYDDPAGMTIPAIFDDPTSPLFDPVRNQQHRGSKVVDLNFGTELGTTDEELVQLNLDLMYRQMVTNSKTPKQFFGEKYISGDTPSPGPGSVENLPHSPVHVWVGSEPSPETPFRENMGNFYSAGRDPIFYCHHMNVDRQYIYCSPPSVDRTKKLMAWYRSIAASLTILLLMKHLICVISLHDSHDPLTLFFIFCMRASGILLPFYLLMKIFSNLHLVKTTRNNRRFTMVHVNNGED